MPLGDLEKHQSYHCPVFTAPCPNGCGKRVPKEDMEYHENCECPNRIRVSHGGRLIGNVAPKKRAIGEGARVRG